MDSATTRWTSLSTTNRSVANRHVSALHAVLVVIHTNPGATT